MKKIKRNSHIPLSGAYNILRSDGMYTVIGCVLGFGLGILIGISLFKILNRG